MKTNITIGAQQYEVNGYGKHNYVRFFIDTQGHIYLTYHKSRKEAEKLAEIDGSSSDAEIMTIRQAIAEYPNLFC